MKIVTIVGARPQFIKCAPVCRELRKTANEILVHTGQHYDEFMSGAFFRELEIPVPDFNLNVGSGSHGAQTGHMLLGIEEILQDTRPDCVLVYGDTNSTLAGALAAAKLHIPVAHVEAGLRSFNRAMPEEINRVVTDHLSTQLFCPTAVSVKNLAKENITVGVHLTGDVMYDAFRFNTKIADHKSSIATRLNLTPGGYILVTVHRAENTDVPERLKGIMIAISELANSGETVIFPVHPRTRKRLGSFVRNMPEKLRLIEPVGYLDILQLENRAKLILTDSGGMQKEGCWAKTPCVTMRDETEWVETVESGWNQLAGAEPTRILQAVQQTLDRSFDRKDSTWTPGASRRIVEMLLHNERGPEPDVEGPTVTSMGRR